jgi:hypothetical protein
MTLLVIGSEFLSGLVRRSALDTRAWRSYIVSLPRLSSPRRGMDAGKPC